MKDTGKLALLAGSLLLLSACGGDNSTTPNPATASPVDQSAPGGELPATDDSSTETPPPAPGWTLRELPPSIAEAQAASCADDTLPEGGRSYRVEMPSRVDGNTIVFQVFEPTAFDCQAHHPLILHGHGFGLSRSTSAELELPGVGFSFEMPLGPISRLLDAGYAVISFDQRGFGESEGTIRVMDPDIEGQNVIQIVDWAEANLDYLAYRDNNLLLGSVGGSYGGGYQYLLYNLDPDQRLNAMVPEITWNDLSYSLVPGDVPKTFWMAALSLIGELLGKGGMDPMIKEAAAEAIKTNRLPAMAKDLLNYHSADYFMTNSRALPLFNPDTPELYQPDPYVGELPVTRADQRYAVKQPPRLNRYPVDVLMFQGLRDNLFNFNEAYRNYEAFRELGGDVRLLTYPFGHHILNPGLGFIKETLNDLGYYADLITNDLLNGNLNSYFSCGSISVADATLAWFDEKLRGQGNANSVITSGQNICYTLAPGDTIHAPEVTVGGTAFPIKGLLGRDKVSVMAGPNLIPRVIHLTTLQEDGVIAGIPTAELTLEHSALNLFTQCKDPADAFLSQATCDAILFVGVGVTRKGRLIAELIDEQLLPVRGIGTHQVELVGIAERLKKGDKLSLMVYGAHPLFVGAHSRDLTTYSLNLSGTVKLPLLNEWQTQAAF
ncbi:MAG: CocE/NonD family hydrolase [Marinobacter sp.]|nr:CocE/NonD family hydrolase [Marinobacter sp.]